MPVRRSTVTSLLAVAAVAVLVAVASAARMPTTRQGTFSVRLTQRGRVVGEFTCRIRATQFANGFTIATWPLHGWFDLPAGRWVHATTIRGHGVPPYGSFGGDETRLRRPGRIACGLLALRRVGTRWSTDRRLCATVSWPSFRLLGANVPVDPSQPQGGIGGVG